MRKKRSQVTASKKSFITEDVIISTFGFIHGVEFYYHIIFDNAEKVFKKLFGKHWTNWTVNDQVGNMFKYLYDESTNTYTDKSLNDAAVPFFKDIYPKVLDLEN